MHINYVTNADLCNEIRKNLWKIPHDISGVICIPRGGLFCGSVIAEFLHVPIYTVDSFLEGKDLGMGLARENMSVKMGKWLVVDDSVATGKALTDAYYRLKGYGDFIFCAVVADMGMQGYWQHVPDVIVLCDIWEPRVFELNLFRTVWITKSILDIDGVLCKNPQWGLDENEELYIEHIKNADPLMPLTYPALALCTSRLSKYCEETKTWLVKNNIQYQMLYMSDIPSREERMNLIRDPIVTDMKARVYSSYHQDDAALFIESSYSEASHIFSITKRPVLCLDTNTLIQD